MAAPVDDHGNRSVVIPVASRAERASGGQGSPIKPTVKRMGVTWENVCFNVKIKDRTAKTVEDKAILSRVSGEALPGELMVLMGPSGAGKSTLLDCISGRNRDCTGTILVNGKRWSTSVAKHACYVMQDDLFYANLTVLEHLSFQAELRVGSACTKEERAERVQAIISELGLTKVTNTLIGDSLVKGISGGQRKRLSFATELLTNPSLLFVDEPTSGLDSFMAETITLVMRNLARNGRTVIATIHQPSSDLFQLFDKLYLLVDGHTVYHGNAADSIDYFASLGLQCPSFMNPTDFFMKQLVVLDGDPNAKERLQKLVKAWANAKPECTLDMAQKKNATESSSGDQESIPHAPTTLSVQLAVLCQRNWRRLTRDTIGFKARVGSTLFISLVSGLIFLQPETNQRGVQDFTGALFFICTNQLFSGANPEFVTVPLEIPLVLREHNGGIYHVLTWYLAKNLSELPFQLFFPLLFLLPSYFMIGFGLDAEVFFSFLLVIFLLSSTSSALGYLVSCAASRADVAPVIGILFMLPAFLFGGLFLNSESTPVYFMWLQPLSPIKYAFHALMRAFWTSVDKIDCPAGQLCLAHTGTDVLANNSITPGRFARDCLLLASLNLAFRLAGGVFLWRRTLRRVVGA